MLLPKERQKGREEQRGEHVGAWPDPDGDRRHGENGEDRRARRTAAQGECDGSSTSDRSEPRQDRVMPDEICRIEEEARSDRVDPELAFSRVGEDVGRWDPAVLDDPAPGGELPAEIELA